MAGVDQPDTLELSVHAAIATVDDPEYPGVSIVDLGLLESVEVVRTGAGAAVTIGLIPTFSGCPALQVIAADTAEAVESIDGVASVRVEWLTTPQWDVSRISHDARRVLADEFTVAVEIGTRPPVCPRCSTPTIEQSMFGPSRCRSVHRCPACAETVEVVRT